MNPTADANLVLAVLDAHDALHRRAMDHLRAMPRLTVPYSVAIELLHGGHKRGVRLVQLIAEIEKRFDVEQRDVLLTAARALDQRDLSGVFDALHAADALHRGVDLHTADAKLLRSAFPTRAF